MEARAASLAPVVAVTKFHVPEGRSGLVDRDSLLALLGAERRARLTLVSAPAGAGKTTLLSQWHASASEERPFAWLSLDAEDAAPVRFWSLVIDVLRTVHPGFGEQAAAALRAGGAGLTDVVVPLIVNEAATWPHVTVLVLDDLHAIGDAAEVHRSLGFLLDHMPATLHVAIATRSAPPLPVARLRARGELTEIRSRDLSFTDTEAAALLNRGFGLELAGAQVARLQERTEGWAAGLQLAGLPLGRPGSDFDGFMAAFEGDVLAYLGAEVLDGLPADLRAFLVRTSILERLSAPVCDAVTGEGSALEVLDELDRRNLQVIPLDPERRWWRYHHLFAGLLRRELERTASAEDIAALHRRAAAWHREHDLSIEAVRHALAAGEGAEAAELVADHWMRTFNRGELMTVAGWLDALGTEAVVADPRLWLARLWTEMDRGRLDAAEALLVEAEQAADPEVRAWGVLLHALHAFKRGDLEAAADGAARAGELGSEDPFRRVVLALLRGVSAYWRGHAGQAYGAFAEALDLAEDDGNVVAQGYALGYLALMAADAGDREGAEHRLERFEAVRAQDAAVGEHFVATVAALAEGRLCERQGAYEGAARALERAVALSRRGGGALEMAEPLVALAVVQRARGRLEEARGLLREARRIADGCADPGRLGPHLV